MVRDDRDRRVAHIPQPADHADVPLDVVVSARELELAFVPLGVELVPEHEEESTALLGAGWGRVENALHIGRCGRLELEPTP